jgi:alanine dehydrogenase
MTNQITIGFPRMKKESGEKRVFLPDFIKFLVGKGASIYLEEGYGARSGFPFELFKGVSSQVRICSMEESFKKDYVMILRSPRLKEFTLLGKNSCIISMLHFPTRPKRVKLLKELHLKAISLDSIVNDLSIRLVEDMKAVAWNGLETAFDVLEQRWPNLERPDGNPINVLVLGTGMVGKHAIDAATKLGSVERNSDHIKAGGKGSIAVAAGRNISSQPKTMKKLLQQTDILVDTTQRRDSSKPVIPNEWIAWLPKHAVIADLSVDPYTLDIEPPVVRGVEGIPRGNLDHYIFAPDDPIWDKTVPGSIPSKNRRWVVSCYSWPGIHPEASMLHYAKQLEPLMETLLHIGYDNLSPNGDYFERALYQGSLRAW